MAAHLAYRFVDTITTGPSGAIYQLAEEQIKLEQYALAVVLFQTAIELQFGSSIENMLYHHESETLRSLTNQVLRPTTARNPANDRVREVYRRLSGDKHLITANPKLKAHNERRNRIVHKGEVKCTKEEALESKDVTLRLIHRLLKLGWREVGLERLLPELLGKPRHQIKQILNMARVPYTPEGENDIRCYWPPKRHPELIEDLVLVDYFPKNYQE